MPSWGCQGRGWGGWEVVGCPVGLFIRVPGFFFGGGLVVTPRTGDLKFLKATSKNGFIRPEVVGYFGPTKMSQFLVASYFLLPNMFPTGIPIDFDQGVGPTRSTLTRKSDRRRPSHQGFERSLDKEFLHCLLWKLQKYTKNDTIFVLKGGGVFKISVSSSNASATMFLAVDF